MKLTVLKQLPTALTESTLQIKLGSADLAAADLKDKRILDKIANELHDKGFPEKFAVRVKVSTGQDLDLEFQMDGKKINRQTGWHQVEFEYDMTHDSFSKVNALLKHAEKDPSDTEGTKYDELSDELRVDQIVVCAEFDKEFTKIWAVAK